MQCLKCVKKTSDWVVAVDTIDRDHSLRCLPTLGRSSCVNAIRAKQRKKQSSARLERWKKNDVACVNGLLSSGYWVQPNKLICSCRMVTRFWQNSDKKKDRERSAKKRKERLNIQQSLKKTSGSQIRSDSQKIK